MEIEWFEYSPLVLKCFKMIAVVTSVLVVLSLKFCDHPVMARMPKRTYPILGNLPDLPTSLTQIIPTLRTWCEFFPGIAYGYILCFHYVMVSSAEYVEPVLSSKKFINKGLDYDALRPWFGEGLLTSSGQRWHQHRKLITPTFHFSILDHFLPILHQHSQALVRCLHEKISCDQGTVDVWPIVGDSTLDVICQTAMGVELDSRRGADAAYRRAVGEMGGIVQQRTIRPWLRSPFLFWLSGMEAKQKRILDVLHGFSRSVIEQRRCELRQHYDDKNGEAATFPERTVSETPQRQDRLAFLDLLIASSENSEEILTDEDIREEVDTFMFEGHDTTTSAINWTLYSIARAPDVQQRISQELDEVLGGDDHLPSRKEMGKLKYLECAIKEAMRLFPPVTIFSRRTHETVRLGEYEVAPDTDILIFPYMIHRDPNHWTDPDSFRPERFEPEAMKGRHPYSYIPFSAGLRNCIGQRFALLEIKTMVAAILRKFWIESQEKYEDLVFQMSLTLQKSGPLSLHFVRKSREFVSRSG